MSNKINSVTANPGSFRDPTSRVYEVDAGGSGGGPRILRGLDAKSLKDFNALSAEKFFQEALDRGDIVGTKLQEPSDDAAAAIIKDGWVGVLEHQSVPVITYPYEWTFAMLKDAALLQLKLLEAAAESGWTMKDASPYNVQWIGARPVFIDIGSFVRRHEGEAWVGYRQFCSMFLFPLMIRAHLGIDQAGLLRSNLDGIPPMDASKYFTGLNKLKKGVLSHIVFPAMVEKSILKRERDAVPSSQRTSGKQSLAMVVGLMQSLSRLIRKLTIASEHTDWSHYDRTHTYEDSDFMDKKSFVSKYAKECDGTFLWDIGCNTGTFSRLGGEFFEHVVSVDGDHDAIEQLYRAEKGNSTSNILPLVMNLANVSPAQGWMGKERASFDDRRKPDLVLCLALIHHIRLSANIPIPLFLDWLYSLGANVVLEFVNRNDEMVVKLLTNKQEQYEDYNIDQFLREANKRFEVVDRQPLKSGKRDLFYLKPLQIDR